jgi:hypothetical protein
MDPTQKTSTNWQTMSPISKLEVLRRYRDISLKKDSHFINAQDFYIDAVIKEGLEQTLIEDQYYNNRN